MNPDIDLDPAFQVNPDTDPEFWCSKNEKGEAFIPQKRTFGTFNCFLFLWVIFALLDPDPDTDPGIPLNPDTDPDPQHCILYSV